MSKLVNDIAWLEDQKYTGYCGEENADIRRRDRRNRRIDRLVQALRDGEKMRELAADLDRRAASCCELKVQARDIHDAHRLVGKEAAYLHAAELARSALTGEGQ